MDRDNTKGIGGVAEGSFFANGIDAIVSRACSQPRDFLEAMVEQKLSQALARPSCVQRRSSGAGPQMVGVGGRNGRQVSGLAETFGETRIPAMQPARTTWL